MKQWGLSICVALLLSSSFASAATITVTDVAGDALLSNTTTNATLNFGTFAHLNIFESTNHQTQATYIAFDISQQTIDELQGTTIDNAVIRLYRYLATYDNWMNVDIHRVPTTWDETTITWNNQPIKTTTDDPNYTNAYYYETQYIGNDEEAGWVEIDITGIVQNWIDGDYNNYGVKLEVNESHYNELILFSMRSSQSAINTPELLITYPDPTPLNTVPEPSTIILMISSCLILIKRRM